MTLLLENISLTIGDVLLVKSFTISIEAGEIVTLKVFEDNSLVREAFAEDGKGKVLVIDGGGSLRIVEEEQGRVI